MVTAYFREGDRDVPFWDDVDVKPFLEPPKRQPRKQPAMPSVCEEALLQASELKERLCSEPLPPSAVASAGGWLERDEEFQWSSRVSEPCWPPPPTSLDCAMAENKRAATDAVLRRGRGRFGELEQPKEATYFMLSTLKEGATQISSSPTDKPIPNTFTTGQAAYYPPASIFLYCHNCSGFVEAQNIPSPHAPYLAI